ncbi:MAG: metallophosphoesterase [Micrococcales bacterium]
MEWWGWILLAAFAVLIYGMTFARWRFVIHHSEVHVLPNGAKPIRVLHISDVHMAPWQKRKQEFIKSLGGEAADLIVNTGDNLGHSDVIHVTMNAYQNILKVPGVFVNGSNDYYAPRIKNPLGYLRKPSTPDNSRPLATGELTSAFENHGWKNLNNRSATLTINGTKISFVGVDDPHDKLDDLTSISPPDGDIIIGVAHAPYRRVIEAFAEAGASLMFAGHTHGGQVRVPGIGALTTNSDLPNKHAKGLSAWLFNERVMLLNVAAGLGNSIYAPVRFWNRPEVRIVTLLPVT